MKKKYPLQLDWRPFLLRPETPPEGLPPPDYVRKYEANPNNPLKQRARSLGLTMVSHERIPSTRRAHEAVEFARARGGDVNGLHAALLSRYWTHDEDLYSLETLGSAAAQVGLPADELRDAVERGLHSKTVEEKLAEARNMGVNSVPTFVIADRYAIQGAQPAAVFEQVFEELGIKPS